MNMLPVKSGTIIHHSKFNEIVPWILYSLRAAVSVSFVYVAEPTVLISGSNCRVVYLARYSVWAHYMEDIL